MFIGIGARSELTKREIIDSFWTPQHFFNTNGVKNMEKMHGSGWETTVHSVKNWMSPGSPAWLPVDVKQNLIENTNTFFILGIDEMEAFGIGINFKFVYF